MNVIIAKQFKPEVMSYLSWHCSDAALILPTDITNILEKHLPAKNPRRGGQGARGNTQSTELTTTNTRPTDAMTGATMTTPTAMTKHTDVTLPTYTSHATTITSKTGSTRTTVPTPTSTRPSDAYDKTYNNNTKMNNKKQADKHKEELRQ